MKIWKSNFILEHLKSIELKILWNHILKPVHDVKMAKPGQPCNYFCLLKKVFYFFFSFEIRIFGAVEFEKIVILKKGGSFQKSPPVALRFFTMFYRTLFPISLNLQTDTKVSKHRCHFLSNHHFDIQPSLLSLHSINILEQ